MRVPKCAVSAARQGQLCYSRTDQARRLLREKDSAVDDTTKLHPLPPYNGLSQSYSGNTRLLRGLRDLQVQRAVQPAETYQRGRKESSNTKATTLNQLCLRANVLQQHQVAENELPTSTRMTGTIPASYLENGTDESSTLSATSSTSTSTTIQQTSHNEVNIYDNHTTW
eukprot:6290102-Amphidinium_carterae.2